MELCPTNAISTTPLCIDLGKCTFCGECAFAFPGKIKFTSDYKIATNDRDRLTIKERRDEPIELNPETIRKEISEYFSGSLKLRQVSAGGDNSCELELNACGNANFDMGRFGIVVASPRHADGIVLRARLRKIWRNHYRYAMMQYLNLKLSSLPELMPLAAGYLKEARH
jgi:ferredoxin